MRILRNIQPDVFTGRGLLLLCTLFSILWVQNGVKAQEIVIPRAGFPYCEPFTGGGPFDNTILGGEVRNGITGTYDPNGWTAQSSPGNQSLSLTPFDFWHSGYAIVDIPFSSQFGIKASFEYFTYRNTAGDGSGGADGISFFMFDADVPFNLGYLGGSLGYAPRVNVDGSVDAGNEGIAGGYIGIGFDEKGNFGNGTVGEPIANWAGQVGNSVTIRAPQTQNYDMWNREVTVPFIQPWLNQNPPFPPTDYFTIESDQPKMVTDCFEAGYRKVFIELEPAGTGGYDVKITMLVNTTANGQKVVSFPPVNYPFVAPDRLKIGFAGATGFQRNNHEIRNVQVNVFDTSQISEPKVSEQQGNMCVDEPELELEFRATLSTSDAFVTCLQLFETSPGAPNNSIPPTDFLACGMDENLCRDKCNPDNYEVEVKDINGNVIGTFYSELQNLTTDNFNQLRDVVNVRFVPKPGFVGEALVYYNVTDNYGLTSQPGIIRVVSNPYPVIDESNVELDFPSCDGQDDGSMTGLVVNDLVDGFDYEWLWDGVSIGKSGASYDPATKTFGLSGLNLGTYTLNVWNPSDNAQGGCYVSYDFPVDQEDGIPVDVTINDEEICEGEVAVFVPTISNQYNPSGVAATYSWYLNANRSGEPLTNGSTVTIDGNPVQVKVQADGQLELSGLKYSGTDVSKSYTFYVEVEQQQVASGNFCPFIGEIVSSGTVRVLPPIDFKVDHTDDWCLDNSGSITGVVNGVGGSITYHLNDANGNAISSNSTGIFTDLPQGEYEVYASTVSCNSPLVPVTIEGAEDSLSISPINSENAYCNLPNGQLEFSITGGNLPYQSIEVDGVSIPYQATGQYTLANLAAKVYSIVVVDDKGCSSSITLDVVGDAPSQFSVMGSEICEGQQAIAFIDQNLPSSSAPVFNWYYKDASGNYAVITNGLVVGNLTYGIDSNFQLTIDGLKSNADPYLFYLNVTGDKVCDQGYLAAEVKVNSGPEMLDPIITPIACFGELSGEIQAQVPSAPISDFEFSLFGGNGIDIPFSFNNGLFQNLPAGVYELAIRGADGCISTLSNLEVTQPEQILVNLMETSDPTCGLSNGEANFEITGGTGSYEITINGQPLSNFDFSSSGKGYTLSGLDPDTYSVSVKDENDCVAEFPALFTLVNDPGIILTFDPISEEVCEGQDVEFVPAYTSATVANPVYNWFEDQDLTIPIQTTSTPLPSGITYLVDSDGNLTISGLSQGSFTYYLEISGEEICSFVEEASATVFPPIEATIDETHETCFGRNDGTISIVPSGGNGNFEFSLNGGGFSPVGDFTDLPPGNYTIDVRNDIGCLSTYEVTIEGPTNPISINTPDLIRASCDLENGSIENLEIVGGWGDYQIEWHKDSETGPIISGNLAGISNLGPGQYFAVITDREGCRIVESYEIEESSDPVYEVVNPLNVCFTEPVNIRPIHLAPDPSLPPAAFTEVQWYKEAGQTGLIGNGADPLDPSIIYTIDDSDWLNPRLTIENLPAGTHDFYFYVVCTGQEIRVEVTVFDVPEVVFETTPITCFGDTNGKIRIVSGSISEYLYALDGGNPLSQAELENLLFAAGTYSIQVLTPAGCPQQQEITILSPSGPLEISGLSQLDPGCGAANGKLEATISGGWAPYTVTVLKNGNLFNNFNSNDGLIRLGQLSTGTYQLEVEDSEGCLISSEEVTLVDGPTQILVENQEVCAGEDVVFTPILDPLAPGANYNWSFDAAGNNPIVSGSTVAGITYQVGNDGVLTVSGLMSSASPYAYYLQVSGSGVCTGFVATAEAYVFDTPMASVNIENEVCYGEGGILEVIASGGSGVYTYSLDGGPAQESNIFEVPVGTYSILVNTPQGCFVELTNISVTGPSEPIQTSELEVINSTCELANGEIHFSVFGGYGSYTVDVIQGGDVIQTLSPDASGLVSVTGIGSGSYQFNIKDSEGCQFIVEGPIEIVEVPTEVTVEDENICVGETAVLTPSVPSNIQSPVFSWYFDQAATQQISPGVISGVTYSIDNFGELTISGLSAKDTPYIYYVLPSGDGICGVDLKPVQVKVNEIVNLRVSNPSVVCDPEGTVDLTQYIEGFNPQIYSYNILSPSGIAMQISEIDAVNASGDYRVSSSLKGANCWNQPQRIRVIIAEELLVANFDFEVVIGEDTLVGTDSIQVFEEIDFSDLSLGKVISWSWDFGDGQVSSEENPSHYYEKKGVYTVKLRVVDEYGCISEFQQVMVISDDYWVEVPNAFTPARADGKNNYFKPVFRGIAEMEFFIFTTWGELVYQTNTLEDLGWDGQIKGIEAQNGNYVYRANFVTRSGIKLNRAGTFVLIR